MAAASPAAAKGRRHGRLAADEPGLFLVLDLPVAPDSGAGAGRIAMQGQKPFQVVGSLALKSLAKRFSNTGNGTIPPDSTVS